MSLPFRPLEALRACLPFHRRGRPAPSLEVLEDRTVPADLGLTYHNGPLLANVAVTPVFWGQDYSTASGFTLVGTPQQDEVNKDSNFLTSIVKSSYMGLLSEYSVQNKYTIGKGSTNSSDIITNSSAPGSNSTVTDRQIRAMIAQQVSQGKIGVNANTLVVVFTPQGVSVNDGHGNTLYTPSSPGGGFIEGYHGTVDLDPHSSDGVSADDAKGNSTIRAGDRHVAYAIIPYPKTDTGDAAFADITTTTSHELAEAITDPIVGTGWYALHPDVVDKSNGTTPDEIGDLVENRSDDRYILGGYTVQALFSLQGFQAGRDNGLVAPTGSVAASGDLLLTGGGDSGASDEFFFVDISALTPPNADQALYDLQVAMQIAAFAYGDGSTYAAYAAGISSYAQAYAQLATQLTGADAASAQTQALQYSSAALYYAYLDYTSTGSNQAIAAACVSTAAIYAQFAHAETGAQAAADWNSASQYAGGGQYYASQDYYATGNSYSSSIASYEYYGQALASLNASYTGSNPF